MKKLENYIFIMIYTLLTIILIGVIVVMIWVILPKVIIDGYGLWTEALRVLRG